MPIYYPSIRPDPDDDDVCPVATCRRSFKTIRKSRNAHILGVHATWDGKCVICGENPDDIIAHMKAEHGPRDNKFYEENLVRVKTEVILEDVKNQRRSRFREGVGFPEK